MIRKADSDDYKRITGLALLLWPGHRPDDLEKEIARILKGDNSAFFLAYDKEQPVGFAQCQLRNDYVEGTCSSPVGYLEGIFVKEECRRRGFARQLLAYCEVWSKDMGCTEFASDCELSNEDSLYFHKRLGFKEVNRIICFTKKIE